jgi:preprotein translocase subunit SecG
MKGTICFMNAAMLILSIIMVILALFLIAVVLLQSGKTAGLSGAIAGGADTFLSKNKAKTWDAKLAKATKWVAIAFLVLSLVLALLSSALL